MRMLVAHDYHVLNLDACGHGETLRKPALSFV
jgi:hypothetical protein